jgi:hypothetical protein
MGMDEIGASSRAFEKELGSVSRWLQMAQGETPLRAGDVLIQRGTNHAWANRSGKPARIAFVLIDAGR